MMGRISLDNLKPHPKNPTIANFFKQLGWVEELGSGVRKMYKYCPIYFEGATPIIDEGDVFKLTIKYEGVNEGEALTLDTIRQTEGLNTNSIAKRIGKSISTTERYLKSLREAGLIEFRGAPKTGGYYVVPK